MAGGPMTLSWADVSSAGEQAEHGRSVVVHEFIHKIDMQTGQANGCPALPYPVGLRKCVDSRL